MSFVTQEEGNSQFQFRKTSRRSFKLQASNPLLSLESLVVQNVPIVMNLCNCNKRRTHVVKSDSVELLDPSIHRVCKVDSPARMGSDSACCKTAADTTL